MGTPKVTVVIPTHNRVRLIGDTLRSVMAQSFRDFEIIVIDDGSTDDTREVVSAFPVRYFWQKNQGPTAAQNRGFELSRGEYIWLFSSDDILLENALATGVAVLDRHPEVAFVHGHAYLMDERSRVFGFKSYKLPSVAGSDNRIDVREGIEELRNFLSRGNYVCTPTVMVRRTCLFEVGLFDPICYPYGSEDFDLLVRLAKRYSVAYVADPLVKYRVHSGGLGSTRHPEEIEKSNIRVFESIFDDARVGPILYAERPKTYSLLYFRLAGCAYGRKEMRSARSYLFRSLKAHPGGFVRRMWPGWLFLFLKSWLPLPVLNLGRQTKRFLSVLSWRLDRRFTEGSN